MLNPKDCTASPGASLDAGTITAASASSAASASPDCSGKTAPRDVEWGVGGPASESRGLQMDADADSVTEDGMQR